MKFSELLSAIGLAPKTLDQAKATIDTAKPALDSVASLFAAAGLDLDTMLAAGPDSLKAHLASLTAKDAELATAQAKVFALEASLTATGTELTDLKGAHAQLTVTHSGLCQSINFTADAKGADGKPLAFADAFKSHVAKEAAMLLAKDGRPPVAHVSANAKADANLTGLARAIAANVREAASASK
jgi:hypothetical protein